MSEDESAFHQAILANLDDDVVRLVYADWLDENGTENDFARAALIRVQCESEHAPRQRAAELNRTAKAILKANPDWTKTITKTGLGRAPVFRRGFVHRLTLGATKFVRVAKKLFEQFPTLQAVSFPEASNEVGMLAKCPDLARLREVNLSNMCQCGGCPIHYDIKALIASQFVGNLTLLNLAGNRMSAAQTRTLATSPNFGQLRLVFRT